MAWLGHCCFNFCDEFKSYVITYLFVGILFKLLSYRFALRGSVIDLAVGLIIGTAFTNVVQSLVDDIVTPPLGFILGGVDFVNLTIKMKNFVYQNQPPVVIRYGKFIQTIISLFIVAMSLFFLIKAINQLHKISARSKVAKQTNPEDDVTKEVKILCEIRDLLAKK